MQLKITAESGSVTDIVTLTELKKYLRIDHDVEDDLLTEELVNAVRLVEEHCSISLLAKTVEIIYQGTLDFWLPYGYVDVSSIAGVDESSNSVTYEVLGEEFPRLIHYGGTYENYTLTYDTTVYMGTVPSDIKLAIKMICYDSYHRRGRDSNKLIAPDLSQQAFTMLQKHVHNWF